MGDQNEKIVNLPENLKRDVPQLHKDAFSNKQLCLFQTFFVNTEEQQDQVSNSIELWDSVPRYSISQKAMNKMRDDKGRLDLLKIDFLYKQMKLTAMARRKDSFVN